MLYHYHMIDYINILETIKRIAQSATPFTNVSDKTKSSLYCRGNMETTSFGFNEKFDGRYYKSEYREDLGLTERF